MPRKSEPVSSLTLDEPAQHNNNDDQPSFDDDPLRDPLLPRRRQRAEKKELDTAAFLAAATPNHHHSSVPSTRQRPPQQQQRVLDRDAAFYQSRGRWRVVHLRRDAARVRYEQGQARRLPLSKRVWDDWFYSLAYQKTVVLMMILFVSYGAIVVLFAFVYLGVSVLGEQTKVNPDGSVSKLAFCDMDIHDHMEALYFSLSVRVFEWHVCPNMHANISQFPFY